MKLLALLLCLAAPLAGQMPEPTVVLPFRARITVDSIAALAWRDSLEPGACVTQWRIAGDTIRVEAVAAGELAERTRGAVRWAGKMCGDSLPSIHGHLLHLGHWDRPSPVDWILAMDTVRQRAPFHLLLLVGDNGVAAALIAFGVKRP